MNFENILEIFQQGTPPEITHFRKGSHPGKRWWLKTVIHKNPNSEPTKIWTIIQSLEYEIVTIITEAYDWFGNIIPDCYSIWIREGLDITINLDNVGKFDYKIDKFNDSFNEFGKTISNEIEKSWLSNKQNLNDMDWHKLFYVADFMHRWTSERQAIENRKKIRIISDEKNNSQTDIQSELDSN